VQKPVFSLFDSETLQIKPFHKKPGELVTMYTCGPTVYNFAHIGNFRTYVFEDVLRRTLKYFGYPVRQAMNLTDVDDKTIKGAITNGQSLDAFTKPFKEAFFKDLKTLNIEPVEIYPEATAHIQEMIEMIQDLIDKKIAYVGLDKSVYFSIHHFPEYGRLAHLDKKELKAGACQRVHHDEYDKENVTDFVLWKAYDKERDGDIFWESPFGKGRPGWHIECSAMAIKHLGKTLDIHVGGIDNLFPHHENEIAQSEACTGCQFAKHWCHSEHLLVDGKKMSKSLGNFFTLRDLLERGYKGKEVRFALMQSHYRMQLNFSLAALDAASNGLKRINTCISSLCDYKPQKENFLTPSFFEHHLQLFDQALASDLNIAEGIALVFQLVKDVNQHLKDNRLGHEDIKNLINLFKNFDQILAVMDFQADEEIPSEIKEALEKRNQARANKNFQESDQIRKWIESQGFLVEDAPSGAKVKKINR
jgi:cysteinyl-tRNA synthetase